MEDRLYTEKRIPPVIRGTVYEDFIKAISEEIKTIRDEIYDEKTNFWNISTASKERLLQIANSFGVPLISIVSDDLDFLRREMSELAFKLFFKGTPTLYRSFFLSLDRIGEIFIYTYSAASDTLIRNMKDVFSCMSQYEPYEPFCYESANDFSGVVKTYIQLDDNLRLDASPAWHLDTSDSEISTNHIGLEFYIDRLIERDGEEFLMTTEYFAYIARNVEWGRRCKEVPHVGAQLSIQNEPSGLTNSMYPEYEYTVPSIKTNLVIRSDLADLTPEGVYSLTTAKFGVGSCELPSVDNPDIEFPEDLESAIATQELSDTEKYSNDTYIGCSSEYTGQEIRDVPMFRNFEGNEDTHFEFTLPLAPLKKGNILLTFERTNSYSGEKEILQTEDDAVGNFFSPYMSGTVDYETGLVTVDTKFTYSTSEYTNVNSQAVGTKEWDIQLMDKETNIPVKPGSVSIRYIMAANSRTYQIKDDGEGNFPTDQTDYTLVNGTINYETGEIHLEFADALLADTTIMIQYGWDVEWIPTGSDSLTATYYFVLGTINITEVGIFNSNGVMVAYATFPPVEFSSADYHLYATIMMRRSLVNSTSSEPDSEEEPNSESQPLALF